MCVIKVGNEYEIAGQLFRGIVWWGFSEGGPPPLVGGRRRDPLKDLQGMRVALGFPGKVVLVNFWATWCKPCKEEMPAMQASYDKLRDKGFVVLAVNELEDTDRVAEHIRTHRHTFPVVMDRNNKVANQYGVVGLPASFIIDPQGIVRERITGSLLTESRIEEMFRQYAAPLAPDAR